MCGDDTDHDVSIQIATEGKKPSNAKYSREPYRVNTCTVWGTEGALRMNNV